MLCKKALNRFQKEVAKSSLDRSSRLIQQALHWKGTGGRINGEFNSLSALSSAYPVVKDSAKAGLEKVVKKRGSKALKFSKKDEGLFGPTREYEIHNLSEKKPGMYAKKNKTAGDVRGLKRLSKKNKVVEAENKDTRKLFTKNPDEYVEIEHGGNLNTINNMVKRKRGYGWIDDGGRGVQVHPKNISDKFFRDSDNLNNRTMYYAHRATLSGGQPAKLTGRIKRKYLGRGATASFESSIPAKHVKNLEDIKISSLPHSAQTFKNSNIPNSTKKYLSKIIDKNKLREISGDTFWESTP